MPCQRRKDVDRGDNGCGRSWTRRPTAIIGGCAMALVGGLMVLVGLHPAVASALGGGLFIGTAVFGANAFAD